MESVGMGDMKVSAVAGEELVAIGLGSCIGLILVDRVAGVGALAHIVLPDSGDRREPAGKFADLTVPELIRRALQAGAGKARLEAVLIGGARMFAVGASLDIGARNDAAVRAALRREGIPVRASETGGRQGRTARIIVGSAVTVQAVGGERLKLLDLRRTGAGARAALREARLSGARA
jgi:chemotaxis protein CheD